MSVPTILSIDAGGSSIRAVLIDKAGSVVAQAALPTLTHHPEQGATEHNPEEIWDVTKKVLQNLFEGEGKPFLPQVQAAGITNQRSTFCLWDPVTGKPETPFIHWQDVRAASTVNRMNRNPIWKVMQFAAGIVTRITGSHMMKATSMLVYNTDHSITKTRWLLDKTPGLKEKCENRSVVFGTVDTWLIYKLTGGKVHATDYTNASATSMYDPFGLKWNPIFCNIFGIPMKMFSDVKNSSDDYGDIDPSIFGRAIPITAAIGDQQSSLFGHRCFTPGEVKVSMGSGGFVNINVGHKGKTSKRGLFPLVAWGVNDSISYMLEGQVATMGTFIDWVIKKMEFFSSPVELNELAASCEDTEDVLVIPTPSGLRFPYFEPQLQSVFGNLGFRHDRSHLARGIIEGLAHRIMDILEGIKEDTGVEMKVIKIDGGVSQSDPLMQCLADFAQVPVERAPDYDVAVRGAAYLAGLHTGFWKDDDEIAGLSLGYQLFSPGRDRQWAEKKRIFWKTSLKNQL